MVSSCNLSVNSATSGAIANSSRISHWLTDRAPLPEVIEDDSDAGWALWDTTVASLWPCHDVAETSALIRPPQPLVPAGAPITIDTVLAVARVHNRVCPMPARWLLLHDLLTLGGTRRHTPAAPAALCGRAWTSTSAITKRIRLRQQITWAADYGSLRAVYEDLYALDESDWLHFGQ
jgi:hypothetical protein